MKPKLLLRAEGLVVFLAAVASFLAVDGRLWLLAVLALAPDLAMLGYLAGPRVGSRVYNALHTYVGPALLGAFGVLAGPALATSIALVWAAHIGADRALGYGLKYSSGFQDTHLDVLESPTSRPATYDDDAALAAGTTGQK
jgi:hypothetical protein